VDILFVAGFAPIVANPKAGVDFYRDTLGLPLQTITGDYVAVDGFNGTRHLGVWPLSDAAQSCFGVNEWPSDVGVPQATIEFELANEEAVVAAAEELVAAGHKLVHSTRVEPWGQVIARLLGPEGLLIGLCFCPWMHDSASEPAQ
jgi:catechol 2,3-dioxygenase-like lactoylglutathione lyase family enzyme